jgi:energy-coupling factor transporter ATP-binding protein EcfA2
VGRIFLDERTLPVGELVVLTGPPGAGKSTVAELLVQEFEPSALVTGDNFFAFLRAGAIAPWLPASDQQNTVVTRAAGAATGQFVRGGYTVVYDGVVGPWFIDAFLPWAGLEQAHYAVLLPSEDCCAARVRDRTGHGFTDEPAGRHMWRQFAEAEIDPRHLVTVADSDTPTAITQVVHTRLSIGSLLYRNA